MAKETVAERRGRYFKSQGYYRILLIRNRASQGIETQRIKADYPKEAAAIALHKEVMVGAMDTSYTSVSDIKRKLKEVKSFKMRGSRGSGVIIKSEGGIYGKRIYSFGRNYFLIVTKLVKTY